MQNLIDPDRFERDFEEIFNEEYQPEEPYNANQDYDDAGMSRSDFA